MDTTTLTFELDSFSGPLDLLLTLISKNKVSIYDIPISLILEQYMACIDDWRNMDLEVSSEFIEMAAHLMYIKSRMLLPKEQTDEEDPRMPLALALAEYQRYQTLLPTMHQYNERMVGSYTRAPEDVELGPKKMLEQDIESLLLAYQNVLDKNERRLPPPIHSFQPLVAKPVVSVPVKIIAVLRKLKRGITLRFRDLFKGVKSRSDIVATFLAVLELSKSSYVQLEEGSDDMVLHFRKKEGKKEEK